MIWAFGEGRFAEMDLTAHLRLRPDPENLAHGFVEPAVSVLAGEYVKAIQETRDGWSIDEGGES